MVSGFGNRGFPSRPDQLYRKNRANSSHDGGFLGRAAISRPSVRFRREATHLARMTLTAPNTRVRYGVREGSNREIRKIGFHTVYIELSKGTNLYE